jgi:hypothetical protein
MALESTILPLALHFEPTEIAIACIALASHNFLSSYPSFKVPGFHEDIKHLNNGVKQEMTGHQLFKRYFKNIRFPELDISKTYMHLNTKVEMIYA